MKLTWPSENAEKESDRVSHWSHPGSNYCLDFHGDPGNAQLSVFSDGNHHMALESALESFREKHDLTSIFYCTTPPAVYLEWMNQGCIELGNLRLTCSPEIVIGPVEIITKLENNGVVETVKVFAQSVGNDLLVVKDNPLGIESVADLFRDDVRLFISNPVTETASYTVYRDSIVAMADGSSTDSHSIESLFTPDSNTYFGELIHHREAPQAIADGLADVAMVYSHLALRYCRIFPDLFDRLPLERSPANVTTQYAIGSVGLGQPLANELMDYFGSSHVAEHYRYHGLLPINDFDQ